MNRLIRLIVLLVVAFALIKLVTWFDLELMSSLGVLLIMLIIVVVFLFKKASKK